MVGRLRLYVRVAAMALALIVALALHGLWRLFHLPSPWPRFLLATIGYIAGARVQVVGKPRHRNVVFLANHLSWVDILTLAGATGTAFVAKAELATAPLVGWLCRLNRTIFVARGARMGVAEQVGDIRHALAAGWAITIFPEGTTGDGKTLLPFKAALLAALEPPPPSAMVQPVRIDYGTATGELAWVGDEPGPVHVRRVLSRRGSFAVRLTFCDPFDPAAYPGRKAIAAEARTRIEAAGRPAARSL